MVRPKPGLRVNNGLILREAALAGLGITLLPTFVIANELASRALQLVDVGAEPEGCRVAYRLFERACRFSEAARADAVPPPQIRRSAVLGCRG